MKKATGVLNARWLSSFFTQQQKRHILKQHRSFSGGI